MGAAKDEMAEQAAAEGAVLQLVRPYVDDEDEAAAEGGPWRIETLAQLDWALSRLSSLEGQVGANEEVCNEAIRRLQEKTLRLNNRLMDGVRFFRRHIEAYAQQHRDALLGGGKKKSRELLHGKVGWRKRAAGIEVKDEAALLAWAQQQPIELGLLRIKEEVAIGEVKKLVKTTGETPPGTEPVPEAELFHIEVADEVL